MSITSTLWLSSYCPQKIHLHVCLCHYLGETQKTIYSWCTLGNHIQIMFRPFMLSSSTTIASCHSQIWSINIESKKTRDKYYKIKLLLPQCTHPEITELQNCSSYGCLRDLKFKAPYSIEFSTTCLWLPQFTCSLTYPKFLSIPAIKQIQNSSDNSLFQSTFRFFFEWSGLRIYTGFCI